MITRYHVYANWARFDPWFSLRMLIHGWHSNSPLSHPFLVRQAFFSADFPDAELEEFNGHLNRYESFLWPLGMLLPFTDARKILRSISGWGSASHDNDGDSDNDKNNKSRQQQRILIMAGTEDKLMTRNVQLQSAATFRAGHAELVEAGEIRAAADDAVVPLALPGKVTGSESDDNAGHGVQLAFVPGAGHHLQNDTMWEVGAEKLARFLEQL